MTDTDTDRKLATLETQIAENRRLLRHLTRLVEQLVDPAPVTQPRKRQSLAEASPAMADGTRHSPGTGPIPPTRFDTRHIATPEAALNHLAQARQTLRKTTNHDTDDTPNATTAPQAALRATQKGPRL